MTLDFLTKRENEVACLLVKGLEDKKICECMGIAKSTLKTHINRLYQQLGFWTDRETNRATKRVQLVLSILVEKGIIDERTIQL